MAITSRITAQDGGFRLWPGRYAVVGRNWSGSVPDPRLEAGPDDHLDIADCDAPTLMRIDGADVLILPIGPDSSGGVGRSIATSGYGTIVAFWTIVVMAVDDMTPMRSYRYASHIEEVDILPVSDGLFLTRDGDGSGYSLDNQDGGDFHEGFDSRTPGAFFIEGEMFDMTDEATARAFDYGSETFNAKLDEHGFHADLAAVRRRISDEMDGPESVIVSNRLRGLGEYAYAYYAPVRP